MTFHLAVNTGIMNGQKTENRSPGVQECAAASTPVEQYEVIYSHSSKLLGCRVRGQFTHLCKKSVILARSTFKVAPCFIKHHVLRIGHIAHWIINLSIRPK